MENGCYKLSWRERIGFSCGDLAQNLIYQTVSIWLLFFYTNVYGLKPSVSAVMFLVVRIIDVIWDPVVGTFIDKANPRWGKYRSWLLFAGIPLAAFAILCFWNGFSGSLLYAYVTYVGMSMCFTLINVPYGALNSSLTRDTDEITILTSVRMFLANLAGLIIKTLPLVIAIFAPKVYNAETGKMEAVYNTPESAPAWFITMSIFALIGLALLVFCFFESKERIVMDEKETENVKVSDLWIGLVLAWVGFDAAAKIQTPLAEQGILWLVTLIPAVLFFFAIFIIGKYELSDERMDQINMEIAKRR